MSNTTQDQHWKDNVLFFECVADRRNLQKYPFVSPQKPPFLFHSACRYFNGDTGEGIGASHQTGWTALVASLIGEPQDVTAVGAGTARRASISVDKLP